MRQRGESPQPDSDAEPEPEPFASNIANRRRVKPRCEQWAEINQLEKGPRKVVMWCSGEVALWHGAQVAKKPPHPFAPGWGQLPPLA